MRAAAPSPAAAGSRSMRAAVPLLMLLAGCSFAPALGEGQIVCGAGSSCPPGYSCAADQRCYTKLDASVPNGSDGGGSGETDGGSSCIPIACPSNDCGQLGDGCGHILDCGNPCTNGDVCGGGGPNVCGPGSCVPATSCMPSQQCGAVSDGCASTLQCGDCATGRVCAGDGTLNHCCVPATSCPAGSTCGRAPDGCGGAISCGGDCNGQRACGGGGVANQCGPNKATCTPKSCSQQGKSCGSLSDGCGDVIASCGTCPAGHSCVGNVCN